MTNQHLTDAPALPPQKAADETGVTRRLHRATVLIGLVSAVTGSIVPIIILFFTPVAVLLLIGLAVSAVAATIVNVVRYRSFTYRVDGQELCINEGIFEKKSRTIPFHRIQNIRLEQKLAHRILSVANIQVETAGSSGPEARLAVVGIAEARALQHLVSSSNGGTKAKVESMPGSDRMLLRPVKLGELIAAGLTSQFPPILLAMFGLVPLFFPQFDFLDRFPDPLDAFDGIPDRLAWEPPGFLEFLFEEHVLKSLILVLGGVLVALLGYVFRWFGYKLYISREMLSWEYGLFTRHTGGLPRMRLQLLKIEEPLLRRLFGLATVKVDTASDQDMAGEDKSGRGMLLPIVNASELKVITRRVIASNGDLNWRRVSPHAIRRETIKACVILLFVVPLLLSPLEWQMLWGLVLIPVLYQMNKVAYRHTGFSFDPHLLAYRKGWLNRTTNLLPVKHVQSATVQQSPFDRRLGLASVLVDAAGQTHTGGMPIIRHLPVEEAHELVRFLLDPPHGRRHD